MSYQVCRWYDPYPRLSFALKLLYLAPEQLRERVIQRVMGLLNHPLGKNSRASRPSGNRWYDRSESAACFVEVLKQSPDSLKQLSAEQILESLTDLAA